MIKRFLKRVLPQTSGRFLVATLLVTLVTAPHRLRWRLNPHSFRLYRQFSRIRAHCCICGETGPLFFDMPDIALRRQHGIRVLRETLACKSCGSTNRQRTVAHTLISVIREHLSCEGGTLAELKSPNRRVDIWDTDVFSPIGSRLRSVANLTLSKYVPSLPFGDELEPGVFNIDLQRVSFDSSRFDIILSSDIMEHVRDDRSAHSEIFRCLKPGGAYIFTVPYKEDNARTIRLVDTASDEDIFLEPPHYHGDPLTGTILSYRIYGRELIRDLEAIGFEVQFRCIDSTGEGIFAGDCFIATKPGDAR